MFATGGAALGLVGHAHPFHGDADPTTDPELLAQWRAAQPQIAREIAAATAAAPGRATGIAPPGNGALLLSSFAPFKPGVRFYADAAAFYVESEAMPDPVLMPLPMVGITTWQQQLPMPAGYFGHVTNPESDRASLGFGQPNVWKLPLVPAPSAAHLAISADNFQRGAIAIAANGIPIFNPRNNTGRVSYELGELDRYGGHCGRADDYHYHIAPTHLSAVLGPALPIAWALDGYPLYGYVEPDGSAVQALDRDGGHDLGNSWGYHYHARGNATAGPQSPYLMESFHGTVVNYGSQVDGQPEVSPVSPAGSPLTGAVITGFARPATDQFVLTYTLNGATFTVAWQIDRVAHTVAVQRGGGRETYTSAARFNGYPAAASALKKLPDTGQTLDATPVFGEDSDYTINAPSFTDRGDGTILDNVTGLVWQKTDSGEMTWEAALRSAPATLGGFTDWRLPTAQESFSLLNYNSALALDPVYFASNAAGAPGYFWTSDLYSGDNARAWATSAAGGLAPQLKTDTLSAGGTQRIHARYVRGAAPSLGHNYLNNHDGTITDLDTGLMWAQAPSAPLAWSDSLTYAETLVLAGYSDWRVPNVKELQSLVDIARASATKATDAVASLNRTLFPAIAASACWSATSVRASVPTQAWVVEFGLDTIANATRSFQGTVSFAPYATRYPVLVVRSPSATPAGSGGARVINLATRAQVGGNAGVPIAGFVIAGSGSKKILARAIGPGLANFGVGGTLADPSLTLVSNATNTNAAVNDNWLAADSATFTAVGAFALTGGSKDAATVATLPAGAYSAVVGAGGGSGVTLLEFYDADTSSSVALINASTRAFVGTGESVLIPGFVVSGSGTITLLIRAAGPALTAFGLTGVLADPQLTLYSGTNVIGTNDNWSSATNATAIAAAAVSTGAFAFTSGSRDAALLVTLSAGSYTATISGVSSTTGTALVEIYVVP